MKTYTKTHLRIPNKISVILKKKTLYCLGPNGVRVFPLKLKVVLYRKNNQDRFLKITKIPYSCGNEQTNIKALQGYTVGCLKEIFNSLNSGNTQKLKVVGVGFRMSLIFKDFMNLLKLKLGYSHDIYVKVPLDLKVECPNPTLLYVSGSNKHAVQSFASLIRSLKTPEPYKGKGILFENEKILLKEGKKN